MKRSSILSSFRNFWKETSTAPEITVKVTSFTYMSIYIAVLIYLVCLLIIIVSFILYQLPGVPKPRNLCSSNFWSFNCFFSEAFQPMFQFFILNSNMPLDILSNCPFGHVTRFLKIWQSCEKGANIFNFKVDNFNMPSDASYCLFLINDTK